jgi:hypothetical protein
MINTADYQVTFSISDSNVRLGPSSSIGIQYQVCVTNPDSCGDLDAQLVRLATSQGCEKRS